MALSRVSSSVRKRALRFGILRLAARRYWPWRWRSAHRRRRPPPWSGRPRSVRRRAAPALPTLVLTSCAARSALRTALVAAACADDLLRLGLQQRSLGGFGLRGDALQRLALGDDLRLGLRDRDRVVAVVHDDQRIAGLHMLVLDDRNGGDIAGDLRRHERHVGLHIGVVGRDHEAAVGPVLVAVPAGGAEQAERDDRQDERSGPSASSWPAPAARNRLGRRSRAGRLGRRQQPCRSRARSSHSETDALPRSAGVAGREDAGLAGMGRFPRRFELNRSVRS